jgi:hypothetical protein
MPEMGLSGLMSGEGKQPAASRSRSSALPRLYAVWGAKNPGHPVVNVTFEIECKAVTRLPLGIRWSSGPQGASTVVTVTLTVAPSTRATLGLSTQNISFTATQGSAALTQQL